jgi:Zn-dependent protease/CBS domain-containing protein
MKWRWRLGQVFGIVVYMHVTFLLLIAWFAFIPLSQGRGLPGALYGVLFILLLFLCVVMHEYGHALTARRYGIETRDITLLPIGGVSSLERMPRDPAQEMSVALAGPAVNGVIAALLTGLIYLLHRAPTFANAQFDSGHLLNDLWTMNVMLVVFNLLPAFPMDGGRVLRALLAQRMSYESATRAAASVGQMMAFCFAFVGLFSNPMLLFIALFVYMGAEAEAQSVQVQSAFQGLPVGRVMVTRFASLDPDDTLGRAVQLLLSSSQQDFPVMRDGHLVGLLTRRDLMSALHERGPAAPVSSAMRGDVAPVDASAPLEEIFQRMQREDLPVVPVMEAGHLVGLITMENIAEFLMVSAALQEAPKAPNAGRVGSAAASGTAGGQGAGSWRRQRGEHL